MQPAKLSAEPRARFTPIVLGSLSLGPPGANFSVFPAWIANRDDQQNRFAPKRSFSGADHMNGRRHVLAIIYGEARKRQMWLVIERWSLVDAAVFRLDTGFH